jgi:NADH dehydrogenase FAD-containing subunit
MVCPAVGVASPAARWLDAEHDRAGRVKVRVDLSVPSHSDIFAVGDTAAVTDQPGIPGTAPRAKQMGRYVGRLIAAVGHGSPYGCYETFGRLADWRSLRLDVGHLDHLGPLFSLGGDRFPEFGGCHRHRVNA